MAAAKTLTVCRRLLRQVRPYWPQVAGILLSSQPVLPSAQC